MMPFNRNIFTDEDFIVAKTEAQDSSPSVETMFQEHTEVVDEELHVQIPPVSQIFHLCCTKAATVSEDRTEVSHTKTS